MKITNCSILIINKDTTEVTNYALFAASKRITSFIIDTYFIIDNSTSEKFEVTDINEAIKNKVVVIDNNDMNKCRGSWGHETSVQMFLDTHKNIDNILLIDSDFILTKDIDFLDDEFITIGQFILSQHSEIVYMRISPMLQYLNNDLISHYNIRYACKLFDGLPNKRGHLLYDTGTAFFENVMSNKNFAIKTVNANLYGNHIGKMSRIDKDSQEYKDKIVQIKKLISYENR